VGNDPTSIWERGEPRPRRPAAPSPAPPGAAPPGAAATARAATRRLAEDRPAGAERIGLKEAARRYGIGVETLRAWCRAGEVDAVMGRGPQGRQWLVIPATVAARKRRAGAGKRSASGPTSDGSAMLVPRDAWDRLLAQLGNLHEAGRQLAEARERAAKAETEAIFLRERLAELRQERDGLRQRLEARPEAASRRRFWSGFRRRRPDA
jgi:hypothetical protein